MLFRSPPFGDDFVFTFILEILGTTTLKPEEPREGQPATRKAARVILRDSTPGRLRLPADREPGPDPVWDPVEAGPGDRGNSGAVNPYRHRHRREVL